MLDHAVACAPIEACGLLSRDGGGQWSGFFPVPNAARSKSRFVMEPGALHSVITRVESCGDEVAGYFHSHPYGPAEPSKVDIEEWPDRAWVSFIGSRDRSVSGQNGWTLQAFEFAERSSGGAALVFGVR